MVSLATQVDYGAELTMREARARYFRDNGFGEDGGYGDAWVDFKLGPVPFPFPNTPQRVKAVRYHDLHHVLTGYRTDFPGEVEISAWEIGAGCKDFIAAWQLNLSGMAAGPLFMPRRTLRAFIRGRHSETLYGLDYEPLLEQTVAEARRAMHVPDAAPRAGAADWILFVLALIAGWVIGLLSLAVFLPLLPLGLLTNFLRARSKRPPAAR
jgi:hypothetical protein